MQTLEQDALESQAVHIPENAGDFQPERKIGIEIVRSAELSSRFFRGWRAASYSLRRGDLWSHRLAEAMRR